MTAAQSFYILVGLLMIVLGGGIAYYLFLILEIHGKVEKIEQEMKKITSVAEALRKWAGEREAGGGESK